MEHPKKRKFLPYRAARRLLAVGEAGQGPSLKSRHAIVARHPLFTDEAMATVVSYRVGDDSKVVVMEGAGGLPDLQVKVLLANHLGAPDADHKGPGSNASVDELVDSRLAAVGVEDLSISRS